MTTAIQVEHVSKRFVLRTDRPRSLQELVVNGLHRSNHGHRQAFWALRDVSFTVKEGEALGLIGENGSGKSTMLKLIARILEPSSGAIATHGRVAALLELGAGFHPDLTGRDNIYLNGSILGISRREMALKFDEVVAFAELERFVDVPLKHYSSGMQVRLGFSIATCIDPEILLIDEVLSVGDEAFQHKCLDRINDFRAQGRTIVFVSHDLATVNELCDRAIWIEDGEVKGQGLTRRVVDQYLISVGQKENLQFAAQHEREVAEASQAEAPRVAAASAAPVAAEPAAQAAPPPEAPAPEEEPKHWGTGEIQITSVRLLGPDGQQTYLLRCGDPLTIEIAYTAHRAAEDVVFGVGIYRSDGLFCYGTNTDMEQLPISLAAGPGKALIRFPRFGFIEGTYSLDVAIHTAKGAAYDYYREYLTFAVRSRWQDMGVFRPAHRWHIGDDPVGHSALEEHDPAEEAPR
ncbi:MAG: ABC transporter ATP-binding protein [Chloroflexi bacterium]|nr:ABC transporter ATP-binding protein [Chloroflexota bacterium]